MAEYGLDPNGKGGYDIVRRDHTFEAIVAVIILIVILWICSKCDAFNPKQEDSIDQSIETSEVSGEINLADKYARSHYKGSVRKYDRSITHANGTTFDGPYVSIGYGEFDQSQNLYIADATASLGQEYQYFAGTYFADSGELDHTIELLIYADDVLIYSSGEITPNTPPIDFHIDVSSCNVLRLETRTKDWSFDGWHPNSIIFVNSVFFE